MVHDEVTTFVDGHVAATLILGRSVEALEADEGLVPRQGQSSERSRR
jgi:hypothetical protein